MTIWRLFHHPRSRKDQTPCHSRLRRRTERNVCAPYPHHLKMNFPKCSNRLPQAVEVEGLPRSAHAQCQASQPTPTIIEHLVVRVAERCAAERTTPLMARLAPSVMHLVTLGANPRESLVVENGLPVVSRRGLAGLCVLLRGPLNPVQLPSLTHGSKGGGTRPCVVLRMRFT